MFSRRAWLRLGLLSFFFVTFLGPIGVGAGSDIACDEFANPDAAQYLLDLDDGHAEALDPDGDGVACNEDAGPDDVGYLDAVVTEVVTIQDSFDTFFEVMMSYSDTTSDSEGVEIANQLNDFAAMWAGYPETAPEIDAPGEYEDIDDLYQEWVDQVGEAGEGWLAYWDLAMTEPGENHTDALEAFDASVVAARSLGGDLLSLVEEADSGEPAVGQTPSSDDATASFDVMDLIVEAEAAAGEGQGVPAPAMAAAAAFRLTAAA
ncbi:MAG TPA: hypothetical protein VD767_02525 [Thermomicrobiales bacterium]|nr:hypothetical protein [Thermomicrobiales bacterium]